MIHLYINSEICEYIDPIDMETDPDIKRKFRTDVIDVPYTLVMKPEEGNMLGVESFGGKPSGNVFSTGHEVIGSLKPLVRAKDGHEEDCGTLLALRNQGAIPTMGMSSGAQELAVNLMIATLQVQQWLEAQGVLDESNPVNDKDMRILVDVINEKAVYKILEDGDTVNLVTEDC